MIQNQYFNKQTLFLVYLSSSKYNNKILNLKMIKFESIQYLFLINTYFWNNLSNWEPKFQESYYFTTKCSNEKYLDSQFEFNKVFSKRIFHIQMFYVN